jgi:murein DD-endopeptidase MepM/ murein hydrolase activator NlpD
MPIKAALKGEVIVVVSKLTKNYNGREPPSRDVLPVEEQDGNYVVLKHSNNEFSIYSHLRCGEVFVTKGQQVKTGDVLGNSGNTGWSLGPHLHFMVFKFLKPMPSKDMESLKIRWK